MNDSKKQNIDLIGLFRPESDFIELTTNHEIAIQEIQTLNDENKKLKQIIKGFQRAGFGFFTYDGNGDFTPFETAKAAHAYANDIISIYRDNSGDGWPTETSEVCWGVIIQHAALVDKRPRIDSDPHSYEYTCDYRLEGVEIESRFMDAIGPLLPS